MQRGSWEHTTLLTPHAGQKVDTLHLCLALFLVRLSMTTWPGAVHLLLVWHRWLHWFTLLTIFGGNTSRCAIMAPTSVGEWVSLKWIRAGSWCRATTLDCIPALGSVILARALRTMPVWSNVRVCQADIGVIRCTFPSLCKGVVAANFLESLQYCGAKLSRSVCVSASRHRTATHRQQCISGPGFVVVVPIAFLLLSLPMVLVSLPMVGYLHHTQLQVTSARWVVDKTVRWEVEVILSATAIGLACEPAAACRATSDDTAPGVRSKRCLVPQLCCVN